ncbi:hypothetical protein P691DRAFT_780185 [Macrolepiota fuliginosa MF-IS2]|uniref:Nephrocystin 3-like N-terminal domain-containing protein n=1 Tax=Macrolepiota fuliginosa MF-IS2 TaxID=1400762 RepID=A0A9P6BVS2_9AGAR|nr:hypothetical protein P691DRAFT_780185 [Macrolepiota fuliginosa MF-IS2]
MSIVFGKSSRHTCNPSPGVAGSSNENRVEGHDPDTGQKVKPSIGARFKRLFKGDAKTTTVHSSAKDGRPQNVDQPSRPPSITVSSSGGAEIPNTRKTRHSKSVGTDSTINPPIAGRLVPSDQPRATSGTRLASSELMSDSEGGAESVDRCEDTTPRVDRRPADMDQVSGPSRPVVRSSTGAGFFSNASSTVVNRSTMIDQSHTTHIVNNLIQGKTVLEILYQAMTKGADVDSSARWPLPKCYPGTRVKLTTAIQDWFLHDTRKWNCLWLSGPAGAGKSAVAQTVAEFAIDKGILGAAYFFSRSNGRYKYMEIFVTLAYQLAIRFPGYQPLITAMLVAEPDILEKTPRVQFRRLIVDQLLLLSHERTRIIILDGLDECDGEDAQLEIIELINNLLHSSTSLPIIWVICSRPESHLKRIFAQTDHPIQCWRDFLPIDSEESRRDTEIFIRGRFKEIHRRYGGGI